MRKPLVGVAVAALAITTGCGSQAADKPAKPTAAQIAAKRKAEHDRAVAEQRHAEELQRRADAERRRQEAREAERRKREREELLAAGPIPYGALNKNADAYSGKKVHYTGEVMQAQEDGDTGIALVNVTDNGYGVWTDLVWINYKAPNDAVQEDKIISVYGVVVGSREYETKIGGSNYVPEIDGKIVEGA